MTRIQNRIHAVPHLFAKLTVVYCIAYASITAAYCVWKQGQGMSMEGILAIVLGFFGGELLLLCLKTVLKKDKKGGENENEDPIERPGI